MTDTFEDDYFNLTNQEFLKKYEGKYENIMKTPLELDEDTPIIQYPDNYYEITRPWYQYDGSTRKIKDGENRRKKLFLNGIIRRKINPNITIENLLYNLVWEFENYYINNGNAITKNDLYKIASNVFEYADDREINKGKPRYKSFVNPKFCKKYNMTPKQVMGNIRNKKQYIGEFYDPSLTDEDNLKIMKEYGLDISIITLKRWRKENNIKKYTK